MTAQPRYPRIRVELVGRDGNAFAMLSRVRRALSRHGVPYPEIQQFTDEATKGDYDHLLRTILTWVDVQ